MIEGDQLPASFSSIDDVASVKSLRWLIQRADTVESHQHAPAADLRQRLAQEDGGDWLAARLQKAPISPLEDPISALVDGRASLAEMQELRLRCKQVAVRASSRDEFLAGVAGYFFAIGAALLHHRRYLSSQPIGELREILMDLATVVDEPWSSFLGRAAFALRTPGSAAL